MTILDAQSKGTQRARTAVIGLLSRGAHIKAFYKSRGQSWKDFHLVIDGRRCEANQTVLMGIAESGKVTIVNNRKRGFVCFHCSNLVVKGRSYANESRQRTT